MDSLSEDGPGRSGASASESGSGSGSAVCGNASGNWVGGAQFGSHGVTTRMSRNFSLPIYDGGNYKKISGESNSVMSVDKWSGYSTPWGYIDVNRWDLHFSPRAWQKLVNNYRGIKPKKMQVRICNIQVREAVYSGEQTIYNSSPNGSIMAVVDYDGKYPYVLGNMQFGHLTVAPYKVATLPQYGYTYSGCPDSTGFYCLEGGNCQVLRTGDTVEFSYTFTDAPMLDLSIVAQQANQMANPLLGSYMLRAFGIEKDNVTNISDTRYIAPGKYSAFYHNYLFGNLWQHSLYNGTLVQSDQARAKDVPLDSGEVEFPVEDVIIGDPRSGDGNEVIKDDTPIEPQPSCAVPPLRLSRKLASTLGGDNTRIVTQFAAAGSTTGWSSTDTSRAKRNGCLITFTRDSSGNVTTKMTGSSGSNLCDSDRDPVFPEGQDEQGDEGNLNLRTRYNVTRINELAHAPNTTWYKCVSYTTLKDGENSDTRATFDTIMDGPHGQCWQVDQSAISGRPMIAASTAEGGTIVWKQTAAPLMDEDWNVSCNPLAGAQSGTSVTQSVRDVLKERAVNVRGIFPGTCWQDKDIWYSGPIWCKIPDISNFHPKPLFGGYGLKNPPPQVFLKNNPIFIPNTSPNGIDNVSSSFVNQLASGQVSVEIEWECVPDQGVSWGPEMAQTYEDFGGEDKYCPNTEGHFVVGSNTQTRTLRKHL